MLLDREFDLEKYSGRIVSNHMSIFVHKYNYSWLNVLYRWIYQFWQNERDPGKNITGLGFANELSLNPIERQSISQNNYLCNCR